VRNYSEIFLGGQLCQYGMHFDLGSSCLLTHPLGFDVAIGMLIGCTVE
jgi:hypothetical protein